MLIIKVSKKISFFFIISKKYVIILLQRMVFAMKKVILVDGNNLLFRSYYATMYSGNLMKTKSGFPTNALYGFVNMINKIVNEEQPEYMAVAFDVGKTFRHDSYDNYKGGRQETPDDLKKQFPKAKEILKAMGIKYLECDGYEADDIIGTLAKMVDNNTEYNATIISSDKDLLQLISDDVLVKLLKQKDYIKMNRDVFFETYGIEPIRMIDLKALMGDSSDNIPGVRGIGEKTALKLLQQYNSLENLYVNVDSISGATRNKLIEDKESAFMSKSLATIYSEVPLNITFEDIVYKNKNMVELFNIYNDLEFYSFIKKEKNNNESEEVEVEVLTSLDNLEITSDVACYLELDNDNYHNANIIGISLYNSEISVFIPYSLLEKNPHFLENINIFTYDIKRLYVALKKRNFILNNIIFDTVIAGYLLNYIVKDDIAYMANNMGYELEFHGKKEKLEMDKIIKRSIKRAKFIYETKDTLLETMKAEEVIDLYNNIEFPLAFVLSKMELEGIRVQKEVLNEMKNELERRLEIVCKEIYNYAGEEFNISSPKQLGVILFEKLNLPYAKKSKSGYYVTDESTLLKIGFDYPIIERIIEYRMLSKLLTTYVDGILNTISADGKIHTIYTQTLTRTGRLSSIEPNLQNIPIRNEYGRKIRKAFVSEDNSLIMSSDYSQIELRMFAHMSGVKDLLEAFNNNKDIHTKTASDIFGVSEENVTKDMRRQAKAVNFGILYGISNYGLAEDLKISNNEAKEFINKYFDTYPGIKDYMNEVIKKARVEGYVKTIMNRKRVIEELHNSNYMVRSMGERMALNTPIQGSSADILKKSMIEIQAEFEKRNLKSKMLLQVHDELIFNVLLEEKEIVKDIVTRVMENTYKLDVPLVVDIEFGNNWYEAK